MAARSLNSGYIFTKMISVAIEIAADGRSRRPGQRISQREVFIGDGRGVAVDVYIETWIFGFPWSCPPRLAYLLIWPFA